jgi:hypothetical protein
LLKVYLSQALTALHPQKHMPNVNLAASTARFDHVLAACDVQGWRSII